MGYGSRIQAGFIVLLGCLWISQATAAPLTPFQEMIAATAKNSPRIQAARASLASASEVDAQAVSVLLPQVSLSASIGHSESDRPNLESHTDPKSIDVSMSQAIFNKQALTAWQQAEPYVEAFKEDLESMRQQVFMEAIQAAINYLEAKEVARLAVNNLTVTQRHLEATEARYRVGEITRTNVSQAQARVAAARAERIRADNAVAINLATFVEVTGIQPPKGLKIPDPEVDLTKHSLDELRDMVGQRPDLKAMALRYEVAEYNITLKEDEHYPVVSLSTSAGRSWGQSSTATLEDPLDSMSISLGVSVPLFSGGQTVSNTRQAIADRDKLGADRAYLFAQANRQVEQSQLDYKSARASVQALKTVVKASRDALEGVERELQVGTRTALDVLDAQNELFSAQNDLTRSRFALLLARYSMLSSVGALMVTVPADSP